ncbi:MAG: DUF362 domain-containing protein [Deltaproteobacteria bacterium]|nr:DUF362 domain-containing protein [Deltaproteobacteria bacterium]
MARSGGKPSDRKEAPERIDRRAALRQIGTVSAIAAGAGWAALAPPTWPGSLRDPDGERGKPKQPVFRLPENGFLVPNVPGGAVLGIARGQNVVAMLKAAVDAIGGMGRFIQPGDIVVVKPNVAFERAAALGATSNPEVLKALVELVRDAGAKEVRVADNPIESPESCFVRSGIQRASLEAGARLYLPKKSDFETLHIPGARWIEHWPFFWQPFRDATKVIGLAPVKDHNLCRASMTTKNWYGLLGGRRNQFHQDIHGIITDLALMMRPTFVVLDGTRVLFRSGPTGGSLDDVRPGQTIVAATDSLAADAFGWQDLLGRADESLPAYFEQAARKNLGNPDWRSLPFKEAQVG